ncbi:MAG: hypothetical protein LBV30_06745 [Propionibacteriaceae bacterium]|jgi:hypothetical protein|nr:hypothetical protein [Propionibacteriaceae bacterium]
MQASGLIFGIAVLTCLGYFLPRQVSWRLPRVEEATLDEQPSSMTRQVHAGRVSEQDTAGDDQSVSGPVDSVSTHLTRQRARYVTWRMIRKAERARGIVLNVLLLAIVVSTVLIFVGPHVNWITPLIVAGLTVLWVVYSRLEAGRARRRMAALNGATEQACPETEVLMAPASQDQPAVASGGLIGPNGDEQLSLWDPIDVTPTTYLQPSGRGRTVRTVDLRPIPASLPVTADGPINQSETSADDTSMAV